MSSSSSSRVDSRVVDSTARSVVDVALERARREGMKRRGLIDAFARRIGASEGDIVVRARVIRMTSTER